MMIPQKEIRDKAVEWRVPPDTVDKDYVLGHFLAGFLEYYSDDLVFKGGTCLRKCWFPGYRFSEDLDFTSCSQDFKLAESDLKTVCKTVEAHSGIKFSPDKVSPLLHEDVQKGFQVRIRYWGANHSKNQRPPPVDRWQTRIKLEISTDEICLLAPVTKIIFHPYSDGLLNDTGIFSYQLDEIIAEKLRSLIQRSYTAPRDFFDIYNLTADYKKDDWHRIKPLFLKKIKHKNIQYTQTSDLFRQNSIEQVKKQWHSSLIHQVNEEAEHDPQTIIQKVIHRIYKHL